MPASREILIIEDNPADVRLMREALRTLDPPVNVHVVSDGDDAMRFLHNEHPYSAVSAPALVFLDFNLPKTDSRELLRFIKREQTLRHVIVCVLTSSSAEEAIREAYELEANCYVSKPYDLDVFLNTIRSAASFWLAMSAATPRQQNA